MKERNNGKERKRELGITRRENFGKKNMKRMKKEKKDVEEKDEN